MAYERFATEPSISIGQPVGGRVSGHGGYIPLQEIPNAPKTVQMPLPQYQKIPSIRAAYLQGAPDMSGRIAALQQKPLPSSFEEAGNIRAAAAGQGQMAMGKAISSIGEDIGKSLQSVGTVLARIQGKALEAQDDVQQQQFDDLSLAYRQRVDLTIKTLPPDKWEAEIKKASDDYDKGRAGLGVRDVTKAKIAAAGEAQQRTMNEYSVPLATSMRALDDANKMWTEKLTTSRETGDMAGAEKAVQGLETTGAYSPEMAKVEREKNDYIRGQKEFTTAMILNPRPAMEEARKAMETGKSEDFPHLNKLNAPTAFVAARDATARHDQEALTKLGTQIANGQLINKEQITRAAKLEKLPDEDVLKLVKAHEEYTAKASKAADANMALDPAKLVEARSLIGNYDAYADVAAGGKMYTEAVAFITRNVPPDERGPLLTALRNKSLEEQKKKTPEVLAREREVDRTKTEIKTLGEKGLLLEDNIQRTYFKRAADKIKDGRLPDEKEMAAWRAGYKRIDDLQNAVDAAVLKEPDFAPGDLHKKTFEKLSPEIQKNVTGYSDTPPPPRGALNTGALTPTPEQIAAAPALPPSEWVATAPRDVNKESAPFQKAMVSEGERYTNVRLTAFTPGRGPIKMEGPNKVATRTGPAYTFEGYQRGTFPYVSAAVDPNSELAGKYFISPTHPNVVMKGEDTGEKFAGTRESAIDVAFEDDQKRENYEVKDATVKIISEAEAMEISGAQRRGTAAAAPAGAGGTIVATIEKESTGGTSKMTAGTLNVGGIPYQYRSGGYGRGTLPSGDYIVTEHIPKRNTPGMVVGDVGFSFALSDKFDPRVGGTRTLLRIHPDGGTAGTAGCIGIIGGKEVQKQFRDDLTAAIREAGGKLHLKVG